MVRAAGEPPRYNLLGRTCACVYCSLDLEIWSCPGYSDNIDVRGCCVDSCIIPASLINKYVNLQKFLDLDVVLR